MWRTASNSSQGSEPVSSTLASTAMSADPACRSKRGRHPPDTPAATHRTPMKNTDELMASMGITREMLDACQLRCGVGGLVPMRGAVRGMLVESIQRYARILPMRVLQRCMEQVADHQIEMFVGVTDGASTEKYSRFVCSRLCAVASLQFLLPFCKLTGSGCPLSLLKDWQSNPWTHLNPNRRVLRACIYCFVYVLFMRHASQHRATCRCGKEGLQGQLLRRCHAGHLLRRFSRALK
jgi:hypothetical protein